MEIEVPHEILWRPKEAFSDGVSSKEESWFQTIQSHMLKIYPEGEYGTEPGKTRESIHYLKKFDESFGSENRDVIPYYWMPRWSETVDPSARTLTHY